VVGQTLSSTARSTGLGSGVAKLHGDVRDDFRQSDMRKLSATLIKQLFRQYLRINGYSGHIRGIFWGGKDETKAELLARTMKDFGAVGIEADDKGLEVISERVGISLRRNMALVSSGPGKGGQTRPTRNQTKSFNADSALEEYIALVETKDQQLRESSDKVNSLTQQLNQIQYEMGIRGMKNGHSRLVTT